MYWCNTICYICEICKEFKKLQDFLHSLAELGHMKMCEAGVLFPLGFISLIKYVYSFREQFDFPTRLKAFRGLTFSPLRALKYPQNCKWEKMR